MICIAGKNNIAVNVLAYIVARYGKNNICVVCNKTETGENSFQRSLRKYAAQVGVKEYKLEETYEIKNLIFLSLEFDRIIRPEFFFDARLYNIHFSLLPAYKGMYTSALPILNGEKYSGVTLHVIDSGIDTGNIIDQESFEIAEYNCKDLYLKYIEVGTAVVLRNIDKIIHNSVIARPQEYKNSSYYSRKSIDYLNLKIDLVQTAEGISRQIRAYSFRDYQLPIVHGHQIIDCKILNSKSLSKPGEIIFENASNIVLSTIDYNIVLYIDRFEELMTACEIGDFAKVIEISNVKKHINEQDKNAFTPLINAVKNNRIDIAKFLIASGADIYVRDKNGINLLTYAAQASQKDLFMLLKNLGLKENAKDYDGRQNTLRPLTRGGGK